jgi:hypothetical protein
VPSDGVRCCGHGGHLGVEVLRQPVHAGIGLAQQALDLIGGGARPHRNSHLQRAPLATDRETHRLPEPNVLARARVIIAHVIVSLPLPRSHRSPRGWCLASSPLGPGLTPSYQMPIAAFHAA